MEGSGQLEASQTRNETWTTSTKQSAEDNTYETVNITEFKTLHEEDHHNLYETSTVQLT